MTEHTDAATIQIIVNPTSGGGRARSTVPRFITALTSLGVRPVLRTSTDADDLRRLVREAVDAGSERVVVCGGDGTLHLAVQELAGTDVGLGILPVGTGDDNARGLGIPLKDPEGAARTVVHGQRRTVDLGRVAADDGTSRYFLGVLSSGFDSWVNERANRMTWPKGKARYTVAIVGELRTFAPVRYSVTVDGEELQDGAMLVAVGNGISYGGGMKICPAAVADDGLLDLTWLHAVKKSVFIRAFPSVFSGTHVEQPYVTTARGRDIRLEAPGQLAYADGERVGPLPVQISAVPAALQVLVP